MKEMEFVFQRKLYDRMLQWKQEEQGQTALLIEGVRRVGKSTLAETFAKKESLRSMLKTASKCGRQVILFCSTHTMTEEYIYAKSNDENKEKDKIIITKNLVKDIVDDLNVDDGNVSYMEIEDKSIKQLS